jgi:hypothetical protein
MKVKKIVPMIAIVFCAIGLILSLPEVLVSMVIENWERATFYLLMSFVDIFLIIVNLVMLKYEEGKNEKI